MHFIKIQGVFGKIVYWATLAYFDTIRGLGGQTSQCWLMFGKLTG